MTTIALNNGNATTIHSNNQNISSSTTSSSFNNNKNDNKNNENEEAQASRVVRYIPFPHNTNGLGYGIDAACEWKALSINDPTALSLLGLKEYDDKNNKDKVDSIQLAALNESICLPIHHHQENGNNNNKLQRTTRKPTYIFDGTGSTVFNK